jgi:hypothetical protein
MEEKNNWEKKIIYLLNISSRDSRIGNNGQQRAPGSNRPTTKPFRSEWYGPSSAVKPLCSPITPQITADMEKLWIPFM